MGVITPKYQPASGIKIPPPVPEEQQHQQCDESEKPEIGKIQADQHKVSPQTIAIAVKVVYTTCS